MSVHREIGVPQPRCVRAVHSVCDCARDHREPDGCWWWDTYGPLGPVKSSPLSSTVASNHLTEKDYPDLGLDDDDDPGLEVR